MCRLLLLLLLSSPAAAAAALQTTWMEPEAVALIQDSLNVNMVDLDEYPSCTDIHQRYARHSGAVQPQ